MKDMAAPDTIPAPSRWNQVSVPVVSDTAMKSALAVIKPVLVDTGIEPEGKVVIGTVKGDLHDIGKNLVAMALEGGGFEVIDLGTDVSEKRFVDAVVEHKPLAIGISAMLTATMDSMRTIVDAIEAAGLRDEVKIMVGGAPVNEEFTQKIKADFYGETPTDGKDYVKCLVAK